jgi:hypothetical protein
MSLFFPRIDTSAEAVHLTTDQKLSGSNPHGRAIFVPGCRSLIPRAARCVTENTAGSWRTFLSAIPFTFFKSSAL